MADNDVGGQFELLLRIVTSPIWLEVWESLHIRVETFESLQLDRHASDEQVWKTCQRNDVVLITGNRNDEGPDSLEATVRTRSDPDSLPVFTIANAAKVLRGTEYAERIAEKLLEYLIDLDRFRGTARIWLP